MSQVKKHSAYQRYRLLSKDDLELPNLLLNENGNGELFIGEVYCRVQGCTNGHQFQTTNHLRKHIAKMHTQMTLETSGQRGGRPTKPEEAKAIDYDIRHADDHTKLLDLPLRKDGKGVLVTMMKKMVKDEGLPIPCEQCILDGKQKECCHESVKDTCEHWQLFADPRDEDEMDVDKEIIEELDEA
ncbi:hypothetical protein PENSUB_4732 [Penicillium subrubescens]|uniref:Uncharacterized protein n=1 Tax=Penicillium subrubescens TaxID=1316194 RepID=A0A1Q5UBF1_9EURO|nr:hypothetical protein PENSUB_4732 [Penicillium subrubescens]